MIRTLILAVCCVMFPSLCPASSGWETVQSALKSIHAGWNLANSLDAVRNDLPYGSKVSDFETGWGQPVTTPEMIHMMKEAGFNAIRVPVTWSQHMDEGGNVRKEWMDRVEQVVKYVLDENMYCIVNVHHDTGTDGWIRADWNTYLGAKDKFRKLWKQIADRFKKYDSKLLFEGYNEILDLKPNWHESDADSYKAVNASPKILWMWSGRRGGTTASETLSSTHTVLARRMQPSNTLPCRRMWWKIIWPLRYMPIVPGALQMLLTITLPPSSTRKLSRK